jgi:ribosomal protein L29
MKTKDLNNLKSKSLAELENMSVELRVQIEKANLDLASHRARNTNIVKSMRRTLSQILTFINIQKLSTNK